MMLMILGSVGIFRLIFEKEPGVNGRIYFELIDHELRFLSLVITNVGGALVLNGLKLSLQPG